VTTEASPILVSLSVRAIVSHSPLILKFTALITKRYTDLFSSLFPSCLEAPTTWNALKQSLPFLPQPPKNRDHRPIFLCPFFS